MGVTEHYRSHYLVCLNILQGKETLQESMTSISSTLMKNKEVVYTKSKKNPENSNGNILVTNQNLNKCSIGIF